MPASETPHPEQLGTRTGISPYNSPGKSLQGPSVLESSDLGYSTTQHQRDPTTFRLSQSTNRQPKDAHRSWLKAPLSETTSSLDTQSLSDLAGKHGRVLDIVAPQDSLRSSDISDQRLRQRLTRAFIPESRPISPQISSTARSSLKRRASSIFLPLHRNLELSVHSSDERNKPHVLRKSFSTPLARNHNDSSHRFEDDDPAKGVLHRPWPVPKHDPEGSLVLPAVSSPRAKHLSSAWTFSDPALSLSRKDVCSNLGEAEISRIRHLAKKNAVELGPERTSFGAWDKIDKRISETFQRNTIDLRRHSPYLSFFKDRKDLPTHPSRSSYDADVETSSHEDESKQHQITLPSQTYNPASPTKIRSPRKAEPSPKRPGPPTLYDTMPRVSDIERTPIERFIEEVDEEKSQKGILPQIQELEISKNPPTDTETVLEANVQTYSPERVATFARSQSNPTRTPLTKKSGRWKFSAALRAHKASLKLVPDFTYSTDTDSELTQILEKRATGTTTLVGSEDIEVGQGAREYAEARRKKLEVKRTKSFQSRHNGEAQMDTGWVAWSQGLVGLLMIFNVVGIQMSFGLFQIYYFYTLSSTSLPSNPRPNHPSLSTLSWPASIQIFLQYSCCLFLPALISRGYYRQTLAISSAIIVLSLFGLSFVNVTNERSIGALVVLQGILLGPATGLGFGAAIQLLPAWFERKIGLAFTAWTIAGTTGAIVYESVFANGIPGMGFGWTVRVISLISLVTLLPACIMARNLHLPKQTRKVVIDWTLFGDLPFMLTIVGIFLCFCGIFFGLFCLPVSAYVLHIPSSSPYIVILIITIFNLGGRLISAPISTFYLGPFDTLAIAVILLSMSLILWMGTQDETILLHIAGLFGLALGIVQALLPGAVTGATREEIESIREKVRQNEPRVMSENVIDGMQDIKQNQRRRTAPMRLAIMYLTMSVAGLSGPTIGGALVDHGVLAADNAASDTVWSTQQAPFEHATLPNHSTATTVGSLASSAKLLTTTRLGSNEEVNKHLQAKYLSPRNTFPSPNPVGGAVPCTEIVRSRRNQAQPPPATAERVPSLVAYTQAGAYTEIDVFECFQGAPFPQNYLVTTTEVYANIGDNTPEPPWAAPSTKGGLTTSASTPNPTTTPAAAPSMPSINPETETIPFTVPTVTSSPIQTSDSGSGSGSGSTPITSFLTIVTTSSSVASSCSTLPTTTDTSLASSLDSSLTSQSSTTQSSALSHTYPTSTSTSNSPIVPTAPAGSNSNPSSNSFFNKSTTQITSNPLYYAQIWAGTSAALGAGCLVAAAVVRRGWKGG